MAKTYTSQQLRELARLEELAFHDGQWHMHSKLVYQVCDCDPHAAILLCAILNKLFTIRWTNRDDKRSRTVRMRNGEVDKSRIITVAQRVDRFFYSTRDIVKDTGFPEWRTHRSMAKLEKLRLISRRENGRLMKQSRHNPSRELRVRWLRLAAAFQSAHASLLKLLDEYDERKRAAAETRRGKPKLRVVYAEDAG